MMKPCPPAHTSHQDVTASLRSGQASAVVEGRQGGEGLVQLMAGGAPSQL